MQKQIRRQLSSRHPQRRPAGTSQPSYSHSSPHGLGLRYSPRRSLRWPKRCTAASADITPAGSWPRHSGRGHGSHGENHADVRYESSSSIATSGPSFSQRGPFLRKASRTAAAAVISAAASNVTPARRVQRGRPSPRPLLLIKVACAATSFAASSAAGCVARIARSTP